MRNENKISCTLRTKINVSLCQSNIKVQDVLVVWLWDSDITTTHTSHSTGRIDPKRSNRWFRFGPNHHHHLPSRVSSRFYNRLQIPVTGAFSHKFLIHRSISFLQFPSSSPFLAFLWHHDLFRWRRRKSSSISRIRSPLRGLWQGIPINNDSISIFFYQFIIWFC
jgi:hypothetical protein